MNPKYNYERKKIKNRWGTVNVKYSLGLGWGWVSELHYRSDLMTPVQVNEVGREGVAHSVGKLSDLQLHHIVRHKQ